MMKYAFRPWTFHEERSKKHLLIWPEIPKWLIIDDELFNFFKIYIDKNDINSTILEMSKIYKKEYNKLKKEIDEIFPYLIDSGIIIQDNDNVDGNKKLIPNEIEDVTINITNRCNLKCKMCFNKFNRFNPKDEIEEKYYYKFLDQLYDFASDETIISISGGEVMFMPEKTLKVAEYATKLGFKVVSVITNGTLITKEIAKKLKESDIKVMVSIDGATEQEHDFVRGKGNFKRAIKGIKILKNEGVYVTTNFMCHKKNYKSLPNYYELGLKLGIDKARFIAFRRMGGGVSHPDLEPVPINELLDYALNIFIKHPEYRDLTGTDLLSVFANQCRLTIKRGWCGSGLRVALFDADGSIYPCSGHAFPQFKAGNIKNQDFSDIWLNSSILKDLRNTYDVDFINEKCSNCVVRHWCLACRGETYQVTGKLNSPAIQCENLKKAIFNMFWALAKYPSLGKGKIKLIH